MRNKALVSSMGKKHHKLKTGTFISYDYYVGNVTNHHNSTADQIYGSTATVLT